MLWRCDVYPRCKQGLSLCRLDKDNKLSHIWINRLVTISVAFSSLLKDDCAYGVKGFSRW